MNTSQYLITLGQNLEEKDDILNPDFHIKRPIHITGKRKQV
jgi:hypothetical protein